MNNKYLKFIKNILSKVKIFIFFIYFIILFKKFLNYFLNKNFIKNKNYYKYNYNISNLFKYKLNNINFIINNKNFNKEYIQNIFIKKINNNIFLLIKINIKLFIKNNIKNDFYKNINNILKIINKYYKISNKYKYIKLLYIYDKNNNFKKLNYTKLVAIKFYINNNYNNYFIKDFNGKFININIIIKDFINFPVKDKYKITSNFNLYRINPITNKISPHKGIDIAVPVGTSIFSYDNGLVVKKAYHKYAGNYLIIKHKNKCFTKYFHLNKIFVKSGDIVNKNDCIGLSGNSGKTTGPHLHFEFWIDNKVIDPLILFIYKNKFNFYTI